MVGEQIRQIIDNTMTLRRSERIAKKLADKLSEKEYQTYIEIRDTLRTRIQKLNCDPDYIYYCKMRAIRQNNYSNIIHGYYNDFYSDSEKVERIVAATEIIDLMSRNFNLFLKFTPKIGTVESVDKMVATCANRLEHVLDQLDIATTKDCIIDITNNANANKIEKLYETLKIAKRRIHNYWRAKVKGLSNKLHDDALGVILSYLQH